MEFLKKLFGGKSSNQDHGARIAAAAEARATELGGGVNAGVQAYNEIIRDNSVHFSYCIKCSDKGEYVQKQLGALIDPILSKHHVKEGASSNLSGDGNSVSLTFFCVCIDDIEVRAIESEIEDALQGVGDGFSQSRPLRCPQCSRVIKYEIDVLPCFKCGARASGTS